MLTKTIRGVVVGLSLATVATTSIAEDHLYLGSSLGYMFWDDERFLDNDRRESGTLGFNLGYEFAERFAIEGVLGTSLGSDDSDIYAVNLYNFLSADREGVTPYWLAGLNYVESDDLSIARVTKSLSAHVGLGLSSYIDDNLEFRGDLRVSKALDSDGNIGTAVDDLTEFGINLALNYHFGDRSKPAPKPAPKPVVAPVRPAPAPAPAPKPKMKTMELEIDVYFNTDEDVVISYGNQLEKAAEIMREHKNTTLVFEGHTDSRGEAAYNKDLSERRANRVKDKLVNDYKIAASRVKAVGYGEERPIADNMNKAGRAKNRRVVGVITWQEMVK